MAPTLRRILGAIVFLSLWETNAYLKLYAVFAPTLPPSFFPTIESITLAIFQTLLSGTYGYDLGLTSIRTILGFFIAGLFGTAAGLIAARIAIIDDLLAYPFEFLRQLPAVAAMPFAIMVFGIDSAMKIALAVFGSLFPVFVATRKALAHIDSELLLTARCYDWKGWRLLLGVMLPAALPSILSGLRIALAIALILVVIGEMFAGGDGLGQRLVMQERAFNYSALYAETILLGLLGLSLNICFELLARKIYYWDRQANWTVSS